MLADFPVLYVDLIVRRTIASCIVLAVVAVLASIVLGQPLAGVGVLLGLAAATVNHRLFQLSTVRYSSDDGHIARKPYAGTVAGRLGAITIVAFALLFFVRPMGFGMIGGLVAFQVLLMVNALAALWRYQRLQLAGLTSGSGPAASAEDQERGPGLRGESSGLPGQSESEPDA
jgi:ATP synthase I chain